MQSEKPAPPPAGLNSFLAGGGELGELIRRTDWSKSPLGPVTQWPQALRTAVRIMLTSRQPMFVWWGDELINLYNDAYKSIVGGKHPQALGQPASTVWREIWGQVEPRAKNAIFENKGTYDEALLLIMERHGYPEETYYTFSYSPVPNDEGGIGGIFCANTDDTERIIGERQLALLRELATRTAEARTVEEACVRAAFSLETNPRDLPFAAIYLLDSDHRQMTLAGTSGIEPGHPAAPASITLEGDPVWPLHTVLQSNSPLVITELSRVQPLPTGSWPAPPSKVVALPIVTSGTAGYSGVLVAGLNPYRLYDSSYQRFMELVAGQLSAAISNAQAYETERQRAESLAELDRAKTAFFSNVSHEFRTPLTLLLGPLEEILGQPGDGRERELVDVAHRNALRLLKLVNTLLDFSRIEAGRIQAKYEPTDLCRFTTDLASSFHSVMEKAQLQFLIQCLPLPQPVYIDRDMWEKIVFNLISNAFKFTFNGEVVVRVSTSEDGGAAILIVRDTGTGIPAEQLPHLFERFHRVEGAPGRTHEGTGIGLALVQELTRLHGGSVTVESRLGEGSTFTVTIPFGSAHLPRERVAANGSAASSPASPAEVFVGEADRWLPADLPSNGKQSATGIQSRVLVADDNADMREYVSRLLHPQYEVVAATNGDEALEKALERPPDLIVSDVMMPGMDGFGLVDALRSRPETRTVPVILLSARAGDEARVEGMQSGADDYLVKPFTARELLARVDTHIRMAHLRQAAGKTVQAAEERMRLAIESADLGTWDHDLATDALTCSERFKLICGLPPGAAVSLPIVNACAHPDDRERTAREYQQALRSQTPFQSEFRLVWPDGSIHWVLSKGKPLYEQTREGRRPIRVVGTLLDITERKRSEESLREMQKLESLGLLAGGIAHDFNNLLTGIIGNASILETEFSPASPQAEAAQCLMDAADRMARLTGQMLAYSGRGRFMVEPVDLSKQVVQIVNLIQASIPKTVELRLRLANNLPAIEADTSQLQQVIMNLVINAAESIDRNSGVVEVKTGMEEVGLEELRANVTRQDVPAGSYVALTVHDTGHGMDDATLARIFDPFFSTKFTGRGLGLAAVLGIVRGHKGLLTVKSRPREGTTFRVFFPLIEVPAVETPESHSPIQPGTGKILVVDDEDLVRTTAKVALAKAGYEVITARDGREAVDLFAGQRDAIDVVLLDMTMPVMDGEEAMKRLTQIRPDVTVVASSGYDEREAQQRFGGKIAGFLQKPYTAAQLIGKVGQALRR